MRGGCSGMYLVALLEKGQMCQISFSAVNSRNLCCVCPSSQARTGGSRSHRFLTETTRTETTQNVTNRNHTKRNKPKHSPQDSILDVITSGEIAWEGLLQREKEPFKSLGTKCLVFGNGDDDLEVAMNIYRGRTVYIA